MRKINLKKVLFGLSVSLVLAMAIGSFALSEAQTPTTPRESGQQSVAATYGDFNVDTTGDSAPEFDAENGVLKISGGSHEISMAEAGKSTTQRIEVTDASTITLKGVNISTGTGSALKITDDATFDVTITLAGENTLKGKEGNVGQGIAGAPGIEKSDSGTSTGKLIINGAGNLTATGGIGAAGIGGGDSKNGSNITISGGVVTAKGGYFGAGIGGGSSRSGSNIEISGGEVTAKGGFAGAGIGGGNRGNGSNIEISGGVVTATGGFYAAGIGGGNNNNGSNIEISGGVVTATGGDMAAGIGGGNSGSGSNIEISGGVVTATGGGAAAGIGGGNNNNGSNIEISGGVVTAKGGNQGAGIGGGGSGGSGSDNSLNGDAVVLATSGDGSKSALDGFDGRLTQGIAFSKQGSSGTWSGTMYGDVTITQDVEFPADLTVGNGQKIIIDEDVTVTNYEGNKFQNDGEMDVKGTFENNGTSQNNGNITVEETGTYSNNNQTDNKPSATIDNKGEIKNKSGAVIDNEGEIKNQQGATVDNEGEIKNESGAVIANEGEIKNEPDAVIANEGEIKNEPDAVIANEGAIDSSGEGKIDNTGTIDGDGNINFDGDSKLKVLVTYDPCEGTVIPDKEEKVYKNKYGVQNYGELPIPTKAGYKFVGWYTEAEGKGDKVTEDIEVMIDQHTLYAKWEANNYNVRIGALTNGKITSDKNTAQYGQTVTLTVTPDTGYSLADGSLRVTAGSGSVPTTKVEDDKYTFTMPADNVTVSAAFEANDYKVTIETLTDGIITSDKSTAQYGGAVTLTVAPDTGYSLADDSLRVTAGSGSDVPTTKVEDDKYTFTMPADNVTVSATFDKNSYEVTIDKQNGSEPEKQTVLYGDTVTKPADPTRDGYSFVNWYTNAEGTGNPYDFTTPVESSFTIYAKWLGDEHHVVVPTEADEHGKITIDPEKPRTGDTVILTATPDEGYEVKGLPSVKLLRQNEKLLAAKSGNDIGDIDVTPIGNNQYSFVMPNGNVEISAEFEAIPDPTPTPTPTPDPSVDPDGGSGGGASSKTGDPFACGAALALLGIATTGVILTRKRK